LLGEALLRAVASERLGVAPQDVRFGATPEGKPWLVGFPDLHLNLSHGGEWVICASGPRAVGVDVEPVRPLSPELPPEVCSQDELRNLDGPDAEAHFARLWTVKEAYVKALGVGLGMDLRRLEARPDALLLDGRPLPGIDVHTFAPDARHRGAVCVLGGPAPQDLRVRDLSWLRRAGGAGP
ncbi:MAG TPA: 4'-phosphopantetheinyl transferase superfamily protein, partial [Holophaga sp.]|nr:4'-phosphopantetheinyl transferase superfamily protein [Holophaga sp.]